MMGKESGGSPVTTTGTSCRADVCGAFSAEGKMSITQSTPIFVAIIVVNFVGI